VCSAARERPKLDKLSSAAMRDTPKLDKAVRSQSDTESSSDEDHDDIDDDDDESFCVARNDESGAAAEAAGANANLSVSTFSPIYYIRQVNAVNGGILWCLLSVCEQSINRLRRHRCTRRR